MIQVSLYEKLRNEKRQSLTVYSLVPVKKKPVYDESSLQKDYRENKTPEKKHRTLDSFFTAPLTM